MRGSPEVKWTRGLPRKPGLYWVWTEGNSRWGEKSVGFIGQAWKHDGKMDLYVTGGGGGMPIAMLARKNGFWCSPIPDQVPKGKWTAEPKEGWHLFRGEPPFEKKPGVHVASVTKIRGDYGCYLWRQGGCTLGNVYFEGMYLKLQPPASPETK